MGLNHERRRHIIYGDTDSTYLHLDDYAEAHGITLTEELAIELADDLQVMLHDELVPILAAKFLTPPEYIEILEPGREVVGKTGLFKDKKKRYAIHIVDNEGKKADKLKIMGMETKRSDTPKFIQDFLTDCLRKTVKEQCTYEELYEFVKNFREEFRKLPPWKMVSPGTVRNLAAASIDEDSYDRAIANGKFVDKAPSLHYFLRASLNTNKLINWNNEHRWSELMDGDKIGIIYLRDNPYGFNAVAINSSETYVPDWFKELPFDTVAMEQKLIDAKLRNTIGEVTGWDFSPPQYLGTDAITNEDDFYA